MSLKNQLLEDMKQAMRDRNSEALGAIRFLLADIKNFEIDYGEQADEGITKIISKQIKQMKDAIEDYKKGGRIDLVEAETKKMEVITKYLPQQLSEDELKQLVRQMIDRAEDKNFGQLMAQVMAAVKGKADGSRVSALIKELLI